jgi:hypothetical protein
MSKDEERRIVKNERANEHGTIGCLISKPRKQETNVGDF